MYVIASGDPIYGIVKITDIEKSGPDLNCDRCVGNEKRVADFLVKAHPCPDRWSTLDNSFNCGKCEYYICTVCLSLRISSGIFSAVSVLP